MADLTNSVRTFWSDPSKRHITVALITLTALSLFLKNQHDYTQYVLQWQFYLDGGNPWDFASNAYGPLHNVVAFLYSIGETIPRFLFSFVALISSLYLIKEIRDNRSLDAGLKRKSFFLLLYNPILWIFFVVNGCNDGFVGFLVLFGIIFYDKKRFILAALLITLAILYKYLPIFLLPVLFINDRKINWKFSLSTLGFIGIGFLITYLNWGFKFLDPILFNSTRESKILSIFRYLRGDYSFLKIFDIKSVDYLSFYLVILSVLVVFALHFIYRWHYFKSVLLTLLMVHLFYMVGHFQFYISLYLLLFFYIARTVPNVILTKRILYTLYWLAGCTILYGVTEGFYKNFAFIREIIGLPHFVMLSLLIITFIKAPTAERMME